MQILKVLRIIFFLLAIFCVFAILYFYWKSTDVDVAVIEYDKKIKLMASLCIMFALLSYATTLF